MKGNFERVHHCYFLLVVVVFVKKFNESKFIRNVEGGYMEEEGLKLKGKKNSKRNHHVSF